MSREKRTSLRYPSDFLFALAEKEEFESCGDIVSYFCVVWIVQVQSDVRGALEMVDQRRHV